MSQDESEREVACTLTEEQEASRSTAVRERLVEHYVGAADREDGVAVRFDGTEAALVALAEFAAAERQCCSFAAYEIGVAPPYDETVLTVTGPEGTRELFREGLVEALESGSA